MDEPSRSSKSEPSGCEGAEEHCLFCGKPVSACRDAVCPHCGRPVAPPGRGSLAGMPRTLSQPSVPTEFDLGEAIPVQWALRCTKCDYELTGLIERRCPECGQRFRPRETWLANRKASAERKFVFTPSSVSALVLGVPLAVSLLVLCPVVILVLMPWVVTEVGCMYWGVGSTERWVVRAAMLAVLLFLILLP